MERNSRNGFAISTDPHLTPGDGRRAEITIVNIGALPGPIRLSEAYASNEFAAGHLALEIKEFHGHADRRIFLGEVGLVPAEGIDLGRFEPGESRTYRFTLLLTKSSPGGEQQRSAAAAYEWRVCTGT
ncbi:MAG TPA: hypothetical protein VGO66_12935 [Solirubrobacterales bacterium]|nr:hypothetical protein [Solirubrobacterales bacterium]